MFQASSKAHGGAFSSAKLRENLLKLLRDAEARACDFGPETDSSRGAVLINRRIRHWFLSEQGSGLREDHVGHVISVVPGFPQWFNVVYESDQDTVYTYKLIEDFELGDLQIIA